MKNSHIIPARARPKPSLGALLHSARRTAGMTVRQAAAESGVSIGLISLLEQGKSKTATIDRLISLSEAYGIEPIDIIEAAGYNIAPALPTFTPYLRSRYGQLPPEAHEEIAAAFQRIAGKYGVSEDSRGPALGQDEQPDPASEKSELAEFKE